MKGGVRRWLDLAKADLVAADLLGEETPWIAWFHLQQAAEKLIKALLEDAHDAPPPRTHNLARLAASLPVNSLFKQEFKQFTHLTPAATAGRYPGPRDILLSTPDAAKIESVRKGLFDMLLVVEAWLEAKAAGLPLTGDPIVLERDL